MSKSQTLRVLVNARLTAAAEEIFALFERTIVEYEEELRRSEKENQRKQQLLEEALNPRVLLPQTGAGVQSPSQSPPDLSQDITETSQIKEEPEEESLKQEEDQLPLFVPEFSAVKTLRHPEQREEPHFLSETEGHTVHLSDTDNDDWECLFSCPDAQIETEADGDHYNQVQTTDRSSAAQNSGPSPEFKSSPGTSGTVNNSDMSGTDEGAEMKHQCSVCEKRFRRSQCLQEHMRVHTGERPYSCPICEKTFKQRSNLDKHIRLHTGERPYSCSFCNKEFAQSSTLRAHMRTHTGEKPYSCSTCEKTFAQKGSLDIHEKLHTGEKLYSCPMCEATFNLKGNLKMHVRTHNKEKPYSCPFCEKAFSRKDCLNKHVRIHTGEKPYNCPFCNKRFAEKSNLKKHMRTHTGEKPYSCLICNNKFTVSSNLKSHMKTHKEKPELN